MPNDTLVIGAGGFIGRRVAAALERKKLGSVRLGFSRLCSINAGVHCNLLDADSVRSAMRGVSSVVNCARSPWGLEKGRACARNLAGAAASCGVKKIIHLSSIAVYGGATGEVNEDTPPIPPLSEYAAEKRATEEILRQASGSELNVVVLRPGLVYGSGGTEWFNYFVAGKRLARLRNLGDMGTGDANLVHVEDLASFCADLVHQHIPEFTIANVVGDDIPTFNEYFAILAAAAGASPPPPRVMGRHAWQARRLARKIVRSSLSKLPFHALKNSLPREPIDDTFDRYATPLRLSMDRAHQMGFVPRFGIEAGVRQAIGISDVAISK